MIARISVATRANWVNALTAVSSPISQKIVVAISGRTSHSVGSGLRRASSWRLRQISQRLIGGTMKAWA